VEREIFTIDSEIRWWINEKKPEFQIISKELEVKFYYNKDNIQITGIKEKITPALIRVNEVLLEIRKSLYTEYIKSIEQC
jgi:hypothetical protein